MKRLLLYLLLITSPVYAADVTIVIGPENILGGAAETDPVAIPLFNTYTAIGFTTQSSFNAYTASVGAGGNFVNLTGGTMSGPLIVQDKITGGIKSINNGNFSAVLGGYSNVNQTGNSYNTIAGGRNNVAATTNYGAICGGVGNDVGGSFASFVGGGNDNSAVGTNYSVICGGVSNTASGDNTFIGGGNNNIANGLNSIVVGGSTNISNGVLNTILGGSFLVNEGDNSLLFGTRATLDASADRTYAFIHNNTGTITSSTQNAFIIHGSAGFEKKVGIQTTNPDDTLDVNGTMQVTGAVQLDSTLDVTGVTSITGLTVAFSNVSTENSPITVAISDYSFDCDATGGNATFNLMSSSSVIGQGFEFTTTGTNKCFINPIGAETLNGFSNYSGLDIQGEGILIRSNGAGWTIKASY